MRILLIVNAAASSVTARARVVIADGAKYAAETALHTTLAYYRGAGLVLSRIWPKIGEKPPAPAHHTGKPRSRW